MAIEPSKDAPILIIEHDDEQLCHLESILHRAGYTRFKSTTNPWEALPLFMAQKPELVLLDFSMPELNVVAVIQQMVRWSTEGTDVPIVAAVQAASDTRQDALTAGASEFLNRPYEPVEVALRIHNVLMTQLLHSHLQDQKESLEKRVQERTRALEKARTEILKRLARAAEYRDDNTGQHTQRVAWIAALLGRKLGFSETEVELMEQAATLHDVGKIGIPDTILLKPGKLTPDEFEVMKTHTTIGARLLAGSQFPVLQMAEEIALTHHERWNGTGYHPWLRGENIPVSGRIVSVADVFEALTHERPYKKAWSIPDALADIERQSGTQFDPVVVDAFLTLPHHEFFMEGAEPAPPDDPGGSHGEWW
ncbi:MAG: HD domain-containing protein [Armatimonadota bacterium]|nr:HD domain-containing protein [Armatimonadota bacterium]